MSPERDRFRELVLALTALLGLSAGAVGLFVTRFEHLDTQRRLARLEAWQDRAGATPAPTR